MKEEIMAELRNDVTDIVKKAIADLVNAKILFSVKTTLTSAEAAAYMGCSKSYLYKLTMNREIPYYKAQGKMSYFKRDELDRWLTRTRIKTNEEIAQEASDYCLTKMGRI